MTSHHTHNQNEQQSTTAFGSPLKKRMAVGTATVMTAGTLLGLGAVGATAAPLEAPTENESAHSTVAPVAPDASTSAPAASDASVPAAPAAPAAPDASAPAAEPAAAAVTGTDGVGELSEGSDPDVIESLAEDVRGQLAGPGAGDATQVVTDALAGQTDLFQSLPTNLQTDLTALGEATSEQAIAADTIETSALSGGYGAQVQALAEAIQQDPTHPLAAVLQALVASDVVTGDVVASDVAASDVESGDAAAGDPAGEAEAGEAETGESGEGRGVSPEKIADALAANPALFDKLPPELQADLTELQAAPADGRAAGADAIKATALEGGYGEQIAAIAERIVANFAAAEAVTESAPEVGTAPVSAVPTEVHDAD